MKKIIDVPYLTADQISTLVYNKIERISDYASGILARLLSTGKAHYMHKTGIGRRTKYIDDSHDVINVLRILGMAFEYGNDAPRGGQMGNFIKLVGATIPEEIHAELDPGFIISDSEEIVKVTELGFLTEEEKLVILSYKVKLTEHDADILLAIKLGLSVPTSKLGNTVNKLKILKGVINKFVN
jgi:hypothetical protein